MDTRLSINRVGPLKALLMFTVLTMLASVVLTWFAVTLSGHAMSRMVWLIAAVIPWLVVPAIAYKVIYYLFHLNRMEDRFRELSRADALTETLNRHGFMELAEVSFSESQRQRLPVSVVVLNVDQYRRLNAEHGALVGDQVLRVVSRTCRGLKRPGDLLTRYGKEGLAFFLADTDRANCQQFAEILRHRLARTTVAHERLLLRFTVSIGGVSSEVEQYPETLHDLFATAEAALSLARASGGNRVEIARAVFDQRDDVAPSPYQAHAIAVGAGA